MSDHRHPGADVSPPALSAETGGAPAAAEPRIGKRRRRISRASAGTHANSAAAGLFSYSLFELLAFYPVLLLAAVYPQAQGVPIFLPPLSLFLLALVLHASGMAAGSRRSRGPAGRLAKALLVVAGAGAAGLAGLLLSSGGGADAMIRGAVWGLAVGALALRGLITGRSGIGNKAAPQLPQVGLLFSFIIYIVTRSVAYLEPYAFSVQFSFTAALCLFLLRLNRIQVQQAAATDGIGWKKTASMRSWNRWMTFGVVGLVILLGAWQSLADLLRQLRNALLAALLNRAPGEQAPPPIEEESGPMDLGAMDPPEFREPNQWLVLIGNIMIGAILVLFALFIAFLLYRYASKILPERLRSLLEALLRRLHLLRSLKKPAENDYEDQVIKMERTSKRLKKRKGRQGGKESGDLQDPRRKYRDYIRAAMAKGYKYRASLTPGEHAQQLLSKGAGQAPELTAEETDELIRGYERSRYGSGSGKP